MRPLPGRSVGRAALRAALLLPAVAGCSSEKKSSAPTGTQRPVTPARIQIVSPTPNQETGSDVTVQVKLIGAKEVPQTQVSGEIKPDEGHIHVSLDGAVVAMAYEDSQVLKGLTPGRHSVQVDFVAVDHAAFRNRVTAAVVFNVK
ncbi:MAG TPA: hypothetical protein VFO65_09600 [Acidimicrobiales bacterium]|nr:hypothetical protein [Acidimicrobiales bacterium]